MQRLIFLAIMGLAFSGCATTAKYEAKLETWIGKSENELIAGWGVPERTYQMRDGKKALEFVRKGWSQTGGQTFLVPQTTYQTGKVGDEEYHGTSTTYVPETQPIRYYRSLCRTSFVLDADGVVESWHHQGNDCVSQ